MGAEHEQLRESAHMPNSPIYRKPTRHQTPPEEAMKLQRKQSARVSLLVAEEANIGYLVLKGSSSRHRPLQGINYGTNVVECNSEVPKLTPMCKIVLTKLVPEQRH
jgi:hypothetical protein